MVSQARDRLHTDARAIRSSYHICSRGDTTKARRPFCGRYFLNLSLAKAGNDIDRCGYLAPQTNMDERACRTPPCFNTSSSLMTASATSV